MFTHTPKQATDADGIGISPWPPAGEAFTGACCAELEAEIESSLANVETEWIKIGMALATIRSQRMYKPTCQSFDAYLKQKKWKGITRQRASQLIRGAQTAKKLSTVVDGTTPTERVTRELNRLPEKQRPDLWKEAIEHARKNGRAKPATKDVKQVMADVIQFPSPKQAPDRWTVEIECGLADTKILKPHCDPDWIKGHGTRIFFHADAHAAGKFLGEVGACLADLKEIKLRVRR